MVTITVSGPAGSGKSTDAKFIAKEFGLTYYSVGSFFRNKADEADLSIGDFMKTVTASLHNEADDYVKNLAKKGSVFGMGGDYYSDLLRGITVLPGAIGGGLIETAGTLGTLFGYEDSPYDNWLIRSGKEIREGWQDNVSGRLRMEDPNAVFAPTDAAWWSTHISGLAESVIEFGALGGAVGFTNEEAAELI